MTVVAFAGQDELRRYLQQRLKDTQATLAKFPTLKQIVDNFDWINTSKEPENIIFWKCAWAHDSGFNKMPDLQSLKDVHQLDDFLSKGEKSWNVDNIAEKLRSKTLESSLAGFSELMILGNLADRLGPKNIEPEPQLSSGKFADVKILFKGEPVYLEATALNKRATERKLETIFRQIAETVWSRLSGDFVVHIEIDTSNLIFNTEGIDVAKSIDKIINFLDDTKLTSLFIDDFMLDFAWGLMGLDQNKTLYDQKLRIGPYLRELYERIEEDPFLDFAKNTKPSQFAECPVASFWCSLAGNRVVQVGDREVSPSTIAGIERTAFLSHMSRKLKEELDQVEPGAINVIVLQAANWSTSGYEAEKIFADISFEVIKKHVDCFLSSNICRDLSAIGVYEENFHGSRFFLNPIATSKSQVSLTFLEQLVR